MKISPIRIALLAVAALGLGVSVAYATQTSNSQLPLMDRAIIGNMAKDYQYAPVLETELDPVYNLTYTWSVLYSSSNRALTIQAIQADRTGANWSGVGAGQTGSRGAVHCITTSDAGGYTSATYVSVANSAHGSVFETVSTKAFDAILDSAGTTKFKFKGTHSTTRYVECLLPTGKWARSASATF